MKPAKQSKDFSVCLHGITIPKGAIYGNVSGVTYFCNPVTLELWVTDEERHGFKKARMADYPKIRHYVHTVTAALEYQAITFEKCAHKKRERERCYQLGCAVEEKARLRTEAHYRKLYVGIGPQEKRPQGATGGYLGYPRMKDQRSVDGRNYSNKWEENVPVKKEYVSSMYSLNAD